MSDPAQERTVASGSASYQVVARRYRPQTLDDLVGQEHVVSALRNAIRLNRITHAYLFTGTRGVGKTSMARIFAKCLNCVHGPTDKPCNECDICKAISVGQDVDVIEIDGASNTGVDSVRELRANVGLRPSRARFKIYYIDEVHMLSTGAFNALLKTLEEPPEHVKFFFATTESHKIPITVLSRCQRFDFAGITPEKIVETLVNICRQEGVDVETDALWTVARRAGGSMRDAQSLLERLLIHSEGKLTDDRARDILGLASDDRMLDLLEAVAAHDMGKMLQQVEQAMIVGVQPGDLISGVLDLLRDAMVQAAGSAGPLMAVGSRQKPRLEALASAWGLDSILAAMQILAETKARMKGNPQGRLLAELGLARVTRLDRLTDLSEIIARIKAGGGPALEKKTEQLTRTAVAEQIPHTSAVASAKFEEPPPRPATTPPARFEAPSPPAAQPQSKSGFETSSVPTANGYQASREPRRDPGLPANGHHARSPAKAAAVADHPALEKIQHRWEDFIGKLGMRLGTTIAGYPPRKVINSGEFLCEVPLAFDKMVDQFGTPENRDRIAEASRAIWGEPIRLRVEASDQAESVARAESEKETLWSNVEEEPIIQKLKEIFQARRFWIHHE